MIFLSSSRNRFIVLVCCCLSLERVQPFRGATLRKPPTAKQPQRRFPEARFAPTTLWSLSENKQDVVVVESPLPSSSSDQRLAGIAVLLTVPLTWGTYNPVVKYLYTLNPPVPGLVFSAAYYVLAAVTLWGLQQATGDSDSDATLLDGDSASLRGGIELGSYLFLGNLVQVLALKSVPADRAGFLVQLTTIIVPFLEAALTGRAIPGRIWWACWIAMAGVVVIQAENLATASFGFGTGDAMILLAATFYSLHVVRLGKFASQTTPLRLAASKATVEAILSLGLIGVLLSLASTGFGPAVEVQSFAQNAMANGLQSDSWPQAVGAILWTGWATCAYTIYAQSYGQRRVKPTDANLIYTVQPIFTALFAFALLGETIGTAEVIGGALIASSVYVVASSSEDS